MADSDVVTNIHLNGVDIGSKFATKSYLINIYSELSNTGPYTMAGLWGCGYNSMGQLGNNSSSNRNSPVQTMNGGANWKQVSCGYKHSIAVKTDGTLWACGYNTSGQLGINLITNKSTPVQVTGAATTWKQVSCGQTYTAAIKTDGTLWCWGINSKGQLGINLGTTIKKSTPVQVTGAGTTWKQVSCGNQHTMAVKTDGTLWGCGYNTFGQLGINLTANKSTPVQVTGAATNWKQVSCGYYHTAAIKTDGTLWCWGYNIYGQLGNNSIANTSSPIQTVAGETDWKQVDGGAGYTAAIKSNGTLWIWGDNVRGQLGNNSTANTSSPVQTVTGGNNWKQVSCGYSHTTVIKTDGTLWCWGYNINGQLGNNDFANLNKSSPVQTVAGGTNWKYTMAGRANSFFIKEMGDDF